MRVVRGQKLGFRDSLTTDHLLLTTDKGSD